MALDNLLGQSAKLRVNGAGRFLIPLFNVKACEDKAYPPHLGQFAAVRNAFANNRLIEVNDAEKKRIADLGINM